MPLPEPYRSKLRELRRAVGLLPPDRLSSGAAFYVGPSDHDTGGEGFFLRLCAQGWTEVMDVGTNEGTWTADVRRNSPRCHVTCMEPNPALASSLRVRFEDHAENVTVVEAAAGNAEGAITLHVNTHAHVFSSIHRASEETTPVEVRQTTIDRYCHDARIPRLDCVKIDTEGHELAVLQGAQGMIANDAVDFVQFEFGEYSWDAGTRLRDLYDLLLPKYDIYHLSKDGILAAPYRPTMETFGFSNWIGIRRLAPRTDRG